MLTGQEYKDSLKDGRKVYFQGRLVEDLDATPGLAEPLNAVAEGYDKYYSSAPDAVNPVVSGPRSVEELRARIPELMELDLALNVTYQSLMTLLVAAARMESSGDSRVPVYIPRIQAYIEEARREAGIHSEQVSPKLLPVYRHGADQK